MRENAYPECFFESTGPVAKVGRDCKIIQTRLTNNLHALAENLKIGKIGGGTCVFLVGGPGNGKTQAADCFLRELFETIPTNVSTAREYYETNTSVSDSVKRVIVLEDATAVTKEKLVSDISEYVVHQACHDYVYLCCVNRGVISDAISVAEDQDVRLFLESLSDAVAVGQTHPQMWPIKGNALFKECQTVGQKADCIFVWPMDSESLLDDRIYNGLRNTPGYNLLCSTIESCNVARCLLCDCKDLCPFYENYDLLKNDNGREALLKCLRAFEVASGSVLLFRDLKALLSLIISGAKEEYVVESNKGRKVIPPCEWAKQHAFNIRNRVKNCFLSSAFALNARRISQALFNDTSEFSLQELKNLKGDIKSVNQDDDFAPILGMIDELMCVVKKNNIRSNARYLLRRVIPALIDVALEEGYLPLEEIESSYCSSTSIGMHKVTSLLDLGKLRPSKLRDELLTVISQEEKSLSSENFIVSTAAADAARRSTQLLQVIGARISKRDAGFYRGLVYNFDDIDSYVKLCFEDNKAQEMKYVANPLRKLLLGGDNSYVHHCLESIGQTKVSDMHVYNLCAHGTLIISIDRSSTINISSSAPVRQIPDVSILFVAQNGRTSSLRLPLTFDLFYALRKISEGLTPSSISEQTFVKLNLIASKLLGVVSHCANDNKYSFAMNNGSSYTVYGEQILRGKER